MKRINLEDRGQDILWFLVDENGTVKCAGPFQSEIWQGAHIPLEMVEAGEKCPIHHPPVLMYEFLKYDVESIEEVADGEA